MFWNFEQITSSLSTRTGSELTGYIFLIAFIALWIYWVLRVLKDSMLRSQSTAFQFFSVILVVFGTPIIWLPLYFLIRPVSYKHERHLGFEGLDLQTVVCKECYRTNLTDYNNCVFCGCKLKIECKQCATYYPFNYLYCSKCGAPNIDI
mgnify:CR=1 FL=1|jgi:hypothetical protein